METINWGYVLSTLFIRFGGVFILLAILQIGLVSSSKIIHYIESRPLSKKGKKEEQREGRVTSKLEILNSCTFFR